MTELFEEGSLRTLQISPKKFRLKTFKQNTFLKPLETFETFVRFSISQKELNSKNKAANCFNRDNEFSGFSAPFTRVYQGEPLLSRAMPGLPGLLKRQLSTRRVSRLIAAVHNLMIL